jgi:hypothetical protein
VQRFEGQADCGEQENGPPPEGQMTLSQASAFRHIWLDRAQRAQL